jgi:hypothetical protein
MLSEFWVVAYFLATSDDDGSLVFLFTDTLATTILAIAIFIQSGKQVDEDQVGGKDIEQESGYLR